MRVVTFGGQIQPFSDRFRTVFGALLSRFRPFSDHFRIVLHGFRTVFLCFFASRRRGAAAASSRCRCGCRCGRRRGRAVETTTRNRRYFQPKAVITTSKAFPIMPPTPVSSISIGPHGTLRIPSTERDRPNCRWPEKSIARRCSLEDGLK